MNSLGKSKVLTKIGLFLGGVLFALILTEGLLRIFNYHLTMPIKIKYLGADWRLYHQYFDDIFIPDPILLWKPNPHHPMFNSKGFKGKEFTESKPVGTVRIFTVGDSLTLGPPDYCWPYELENILKKKKRKFEVINAGAYGYSSSQGVERYKEILKYSPDIVTFGFGWNDAVLTRGPPDSHYGHCPAFILKSLKFFYKIRIFQLVKNAKLWLSKRDQELRPRVSLEQFTENIEKVIQLSRQNNVKLILITRPWAFNPATLTEEQKWRLNVPKYNEALRKVAYEYNVSVIDAEQIFKVQRKYFPDECHLDKKGCQLLAAKVADYLPRLFHASKVMLIGIDGATWIAMRPLILENDDMNKI